MKKNIYAILLLLISNFIFGQTKVVQTDEIKLNNYIVQNTKEFTFENNLVNGEGWTILENQFKENKYVAWGEYHNSAILSQLTSIALSSASKYNFKTWCIETSPATANELMLIGKMKNPIDTLLKITAQGPPEYGVFPFFMTKDDGNMLVTADKFKYTIWGIDQEFQMTFPYFIDKSYNSLDKKTKKNYVAVYDSLMAKWWHPEKILLDSLTKVVSKSYKPSLTDIETSKHIYDLDQTSSYLANSKRANLMKQNFYNYYNQNNNAKVFFKMGANHLAKGSNLMGKIYDIGNSVFELSQQENSNFVNVYFTLRYQDIEGKIVDNSIAENPEYPSEFAKLYNKEKWIVIDVRAIRQKLKYDKTLTPETYEAIEKYDIIVVSPEIHKE